MALGVIAALALAGIGYATTTNLNPRTHHSRTGAGYRTITRHSTPPSSSVTGSAAPGSATPGSAVPGGTASDPTGAPKLADNPLFGPGVALRPITCPLPPFQATETASRAYVTALLPCLETAWNPVLAGARLPAQAPKLAFPRGQSWSSACGTTNKADGVAAFYCGKDDTLYMPFEGLEGADGSDYWSLLVFAHEYGHHVQHQAGVQSAYNTARWNENDPNSPTALELSRRFELQAECFAGLFYGAAAGHGSVTAKQAEAAFRADAHSGDDFQRGGAAKRDHGTGQHIESWARRGMQLKTTAGCNTWLSPLIDVS